MIPSFQIVISGIVQGVGFRPFIYNLATKHDLKGYVSNNQFGVLIVAQEKEAAIIRFYNELKRRYPKNSTVQHIAISEILVAEKFDTFSIKPTAENIAVNSLLTPDFAICENCKKEILDSKNRRFYYPFISCTECGPRYAIATKFPFERENTSLQSFKMCKKCLEEYHSPKDIRFHSQTNSCPDCGIQISLTDNAGNVISGNNREIFETIFQKLHEGKIIAVKNNSGYLLLCDATNPDAVQELRNRKKRQTKPFAVLFTDIPQIENYLHYDKTEKNMLLSVQTPIVILSIKEKLDLALQQITPNVNTVGAMLPNSGTLFLISKLFHKPLIATSGNFNGSPICSTTIEATESLHTVADYFLHHNLEIQHSQDDSVIKFSNKHKQKIILRRSRGFAPNLDVPLSKSTDKKVLALGADLKNTLTLAQNHQVYTTEYIGDLAHYETYKRFENKVRSYANFFNFSPDSILHDKHPNYENNKIIRDLKGKNEATENFKIQHHEAHFSAILAEKKLWNRSKILGVIWDGTGYGSETEIFGGEFFEYLRQKPIKRIAHLGYFSWIAGDKMAKNPKIAALSISNCNNHFWKYFNSNEIKIYSNLIKNKTIKSSSMGRLIDAVAFVLGFHNPILFEGEAAMYLEKLAQEAYNKPHVKLKDYLRDENISNTIPTKKLLTQLIKASKSETNWETAALNFHYTLVKCIEKIALFSKSKEIAFSGGVFQNSVFVDLIIDHLKPNFKLHFHELLSPNDENISFGQLNHYLHLKN
ncbi:carbamoyltransferase HypF [Flavobacterium sp. 3-218]